MGIVGVVLWAACGGVEKDVADVPSLNVPTGGDGLGEAPKARDDAWEVWQNRTISENVTANDDGDSLEVTAVGSPENGTVEIDGKRTVAYTPNDDYVGSDSFTYVISDDAGRTSEATVEVEVLEFPTLIITGPDDGTEVENDAFEISFEVVGCDVSSPSSNAAGCHLHGFIDGDGVDPQGHFDPSDWEMATDTVGPIEVELRLYVNDGSDDPFDPYIRDFVDLVAIEPAETGGTTESGTGTGTDPGTGGTGGSDPTDTGGTEPTDDGGDGTEPGDTGATELGGDDTGVSTETSSSDTGGETTSTETRGG